MASGSELLHTVSGPLFTSSLGVGCVTAWIRTKPWGCWGHGLNREVWKEPGDKCLLESSVRRRKGWEEPRITNTGNEFSTTTSSPLFGPPLLYSPGAEQMLVHLHDEVKFGVKIPTLYRWHQKVELQLGVAMSVGRRCGCLVVLSSAKENGLQGKKEHFRNSLVENRQIIFLPFLQMLWD